MELLLVKEGGYSLEEINGRSAERVYTRPPTLVEALETVEYERMGRPAAAVWFVLALTGAGIPLSTLAAVLVLVVSLAVQVKTANDGQRAAREKVSYPGMSEPEVWRRIVALDELIDMRNDKAEDERKRSVRESGGLPNVK